MRVLLVQPRPRSNLGLQGILRSEPLGLEVVAGALLRDGHQVRLLDLLEGKLPAEEVREFKPQAVGISCSFTVDTYQVLELAQTLRQLIPGAFIFVGGHHATLNPGSLFRPAIDAIVAGEGETTTPELVAALDGNQDLSRVSGLVLNHYPEGQVFTGERPLLDDLDAVPIPPRGLTNRYRQRYFMGFCRPLITVETSRGCPYRCNFCSVWNFYRHRFRVMSTGRVAEELAQLPPGDILFANDNFLANIRQVGELISLIKSERLPRREYTIQARSDAIVANPELVAELKELGLRSVFIGFEKANDEGLASVEKRNSVENNERALKLLRSLGIGVNAAFIVDPQFTRTDFQKLRDYIRRLRIEQPYFSILTPLPGTKLFEEAGDRVTTGNCELYDLLHAVLPTRLPLAEFYREFVRLYRGAYLTWPALLALLWQAVKNLALGGVSLADVWQLWSGVRLTSDPEFFLAAHRSG
jgi:radical SAM superfamily enzyme YgiQ (UPF0313 family)